MSNQAMLEQKFDERMWEIYHRAKEELGYNATRYLHMLGRHGGLETARRLLHAQGVSEGYTTLWEKKRLDLTVEALIHDNLEFHPLFDESQLTIARRRLQEYGYPEAAGS